MRPPSYATEHPYYQRAKARAEATGRPLSWAFWDLGLWRPFAARGGAELRPPLDPQRGLPGHEFRPVALPPAPPGWRRRRQGRRWLDTPEPTRSPNRQPELTFGR